MNMVVTFSCVVEGWIKNEDIRVWTLVCRKLENAKPNYSAWEQISIESCSQANLPWYPVKFRPHIQRHNKRHISYFPMIGLLLVKQQLRFVSCHEEKHHWILQLQELVVVFDRYTWVFILFTLFMTIAILRIHLAKNSIKYEFGNLSFALFGSMVDQASNLFQFDSHRSPQGQYFSLAFIPLAFLILGNYYKGDNIKKLTTTFGAI